MTIEAEVSSMLPEPSREKQKGKIKSALERFTQRVQEVGVSYRVTSVMPAAEAADADENENDLAEHSAVEARAKDVAFSDEDFSLKKPPFKLKEVISRELFNKVQDLNKQMTMMGSQTRTMDNTAPERPASFAGQQDRQSPSVASPRNYDHAHLALFSQEEQTGKKRPPSKTKAAATKSKSKKSPKLRKPKQK